MDTAFGYISTVLFSVAVFGNLFITRNTLNKSTLKKKRVAKLGVTFTAITCGSVVFIVVVQFVARTLAEDKDAAGWVAVVIYFAGAVYLAWCTSLYRRYIVKLEGQRAQAKQ